MRHRSAIREIATFSVFIFGGIGLGFCLLLVQRINKNLWSLAIRLRR
jgi:hypothetical protein